MAQSRWVDRGVLLVEAAVGIGVVSAIVGRTYGFSSTLVFVLTGAAAAYSGYVLIKMMSSLSDESLEVGGRVEDEARAALEHEKMLLLQGIKELEADAAVGKVDAADYEHLRSTAETRALEIIRELKQSDAHWMGKAEDLVAKRLGRAGPTAAPRADVTVGGTREQRRARPAFAGLFDHRPVEISDGKCSGCATNNDVDASFCVGCGRPITRVGDEEEAA